jgi:hypothetical protein
LVYGRCSVRPYAKIARWERKEPLPDAAWRRWRRRGVPPAIPFVSHLLSNRPLEGARTGLPARRRTRQRSRPRGRESSGRRLSPHSTKRARADHHRHSGIAPSIPTAQRHAHDSASRRSFGIRSGSPTNESYRCVGTHDVSLDARDVFVDAHVVCGEADVVSAASIRSERSLAPPSMYVEQDEGFAVRARRFVFQASSSRRARPGRPRRATRSSTRYERVELLELARRHR